MKAPIRKTIRWPVLHMLLHILWSTLLFGILQGCSKSEDTGTYTPIPTPEPVMYDPTPMPFEIPSNFPALTYDLKSNTPTRKGFELGKKLFYEGKLASDAVVSCGFCHIQENAFTHHAHIVSHGVDGKLGTRNAQGLFNLAFMNEFTWDGAANHLDTQPIIPITAPNEMNETFASIISKLEQHKSYPKLFAQAFKNQKIDAENILKALSQFMIVMISAESKYDRFERGEGNITLSADELAGKTLFDAKCGRCHATTLFTDQSYRNNGLPIDPKYNDIGRERVSGKAEDRGKFKVPTLRNIELTFPYMHDGRFTTLEEVLKFYADGMIDSPSLDAGFRDEEKPTKVGIVMTDEEQKLIIAFLKTLSDTNFAKNPIFSEF